MIDGAVDAALVARRAHARIRLRGNGTLGDEEELSGHCGEIERWGLLEFGMQLAGDVDYVAAVNWQAALLLYHVGVVPKVIEGVQQTQSDVRMIVHKGLDGEDGAVPADDVAGTQ